MGAVRTTNYTIVSSLVWSRIAVGGLLVDEFDPIKEGKEFKNTFE